MPTIEIPSEEVLLMEDEIVSQDVLFDEFTEIKEAVEKVKTYEPYVITAYCPCEKCCGVRTGITASGTIATEGRTIAVDTNLIQYGTKIEIEGVDGIFIAEDCGGAVKGNRLDMFFNSHEKAVEWGRQIRNVYIRRD
jgi:3D (Asp-Asp-Asp) domain-containing protein